jgi:hypothetical protein
VVATFLGNTYLGLDGFPWDRRALLFPLRTIQNLQDLKTILSESGNAIPQGPAARGQLFWRKRVAPFQLFGHEAENAGIYGIEPSAITVKGFAAVLFGHRLASVQSRHCPLHKIVISSQTV